MRKGGSKALTTLQLNKELRSVRSLNALAAIVEARCLEFDGHHVATSIYSLAKLASGRSADVAGFAVAGLLSQRLEEELHRDGLRHRSLSNVCWAVAKLSAATPLLEGCAISLAIAGASRAFEMNSQGLSNTCWAMAILQMKLRALLWRKPWRILTVMCRSGSVER
ncbi:unnamed protein product [Durusdinium trenchii]|uniref:Uncharacterized protein n=1 Tax=Durusdinium trenchii TaxID=1381693 RepID=A0ABP0I4Q0_9DINO